MTQVHVFTQAISQMPHVQTRCRILGIFYIGDPCIHRSNMGNVPSANTPFPDQICYLGQCRLTCVYTGLSPGMPQVRTLPKLHLIFKYIKLNRFSPGFPLHSAIFYTFPPLVDAPASYKFTQVALPLWHLELHFRLAFRQAQALVLHGPLQLHLIIPCPPWRDTDLTAARSETFFQLPGSLHLSTTPCSPSCAGVTDLMGARSD